VKVHFVLGKEAAHAEKLEIRMSKFETTELTMVQAPDVSTTSVKKPRNHMKARRSLKGMSNLCPNLPRGQIARTLHKRYCIIIVKAPVQARWNGFHGTAVRCSYIHAAPNVICRLQF